MDDRKEPITALLQRAASGDKAAAEELIPLVYGQLKSIAHARVQRHAKNKTLRTTDLVHEALLRIFGKGDPGFEGRREFLWAASRAMRNILVEQARRKAALKRDVGRNQPLDGDVPEIATDPPIENSLTVHEALERLEEEHPRPGKLVTLRYFGGLMMPEVAEVLGISLATAERDWRFARAHLRQHLEASGF